MNFITDLKLINSSDTPFGFTKIEQDLNSLAGGDYIYLCYKSEELPLEVVTDIRIINTGKNNSKPTIKGYTTLDLELNHGAGGDYIWLAFKKSKYNEDIGGITDIKFETSLVSKSLIFDNLSETGYTIIWEDLNKNAGGKWIYLSYKREFPLLKRWMSKIYDYTSIADISLVGTHDSSMWQSNMKSEKDTIDSDGGGTLGWLAECQHLTFKQQFDAGVRMFDMRIFWNGDKIGLCHSSDIGHIGDIGSYSLLSFETVLEQLVEKLKENPTEFICLKIQPEQYIIGNAVEPYCKFVDNILKKYRDYIYIDQQYDSVKDGQNLKLIRRNRNQLPKLKDLRGKILITSSVSGKSVKVFSTNDNVCLEGGYPKDPWRYRYVSETERIHLEDNNKKKEDDDSISGLSDGVLLGKKRDSARGAENLKSHIESVNSVTSTEEINKMNIPSCYSQKEEFPSLNGWPIDFARQYNPSNLNWLYDNLETQMLSRPYFRIGWFDIDFIGQDLVWEIIKANRDIFEQYVAKLPDYEVKILNTNSGTNIFSLGWDKKLYLIKEKQSRKFERYTLISNVTSFIAQLINNNTFFIAIICDNKVYTTFTTTPEKLSLADFTMINLANVICDKKLNPVKLIVSTTGKSSTLFIESKNESGYIEQFTVNISLNNIGVPKIAPLPTNFSDISKIEVGRATNQFVDGVYVSGNFNDTSTLLYIPISNPFGSTSPTPIRFKANCNLDVVCSVSLTNNIGTHLFAIGDGEISYYNYNEQNDWLNDKGKGLPVSLIKFERLKKAEQLEVTYINNKIHFFVRNSYGEVYFISGDYLNDKPVNFINEPVLIMEKATHVSVKGNKIIICTETDFLESDIDSNGNLNFNKITLGV
ncbi:MAG: hypothetical protein LBR30_01690 [Clostridioides sp.]|jgi:hypothetical protein|nr:hypothetical protein [Clostridioides sp.]